MIHEFTDDAWPRFVYVLEVSIEGGPWRKVRVECERLNRLAGGKRRVQIQEFEMEETR